MQIYFPSPVQELVSNCSLQPFLIEQKDERIIFTFSIKAETFIDFVRESYQYSNCAREFLDRLEQLKESSKWDHFYVELVVEKDEGTDEWSDRLYHFKVFPSLPWDEGSAEDEGLLATVNEFISAEMGNDCEMTVIKINSYFSIFR